MSSRKILLLLLAFAVLAIASCKNDDEECNPREQGKYLKSVSYWGLDIGLHIYEPVPAADSFLYVTEYLYNEQRQLIETKDNRYHGDTLLSTRSTTYTYDDCGKVTIENEDSGSYINTYIYDADDRCVRINKAQNGLSGVYDSIVYDGNKITLYYCLNGEYIGLWFEFETDPLTQNVTVSRWAIAGDTGQIHYLYDDKINPFKKLQLPFSNGFVKGISTNNMVLESHDPNDYEYHYTYDADGYPLTGNGDMYAYEEL